MNLVEINHAMSKIKDWSLDTDSISKIFSFGNFKMAMEFVNKIAELAEKHNHHPDILVSYNQVRLVLTTHYEKSLTKKDFDLAEEIDKI